MTPAPAFSTADPIRPTAAGLTTPAYRGNGSAVESVGRDTHALPVWWVGCGAGVVRARLPRAALATVAGIALGLGAALGWLMIGLTLMEVRRVRAHRAGEIGGCPL